MKLVSVGIVGKPHGFRGEFLLSMRGSSGPLPGNPADLYLGATPDEARAFPVEGFVPMPKGLRVKLQGVDSDAAVKALTGTPVFIDRNLLPSLAPGEYYTGDLVGCEVWDEPTGERVGTLCGVESIGEGCVDRWWVQSGNDRFALPAEKNTILRVDPQKRVIWVRNAADFSGK